MVAWEVTGMKSEKGTSTLEASICRQKEMRMYIPVDIVHDFQVLGRETDGRGIL